MKGEIIDFRVEGTYCFNYHNIVPGSIEGINV